MAKATRKKLQCNMVCFGTDRLLTLFVMLDHWITGSLDQCQWMLDMICFTIYLCKSILSLRERQEGNLLSTYGST